MNYVGKSGRCFTISEQRHGVSNIALKKLNRSKIFQHLYRGEETSVLQISNTLKISVPTVSQNIRELQDRDLVEVRGTFASTGGRRAHAIMYNRNAYFTIGIDLTKSYIVWSIVDFGGELKRNKKIRLPFSDRPEYYQQLGAIINGIPRQVGITREKILGVGIAVPAIVAPDGLKMTYAHVLSEQPIHMDLLSEYTDLPFVLYNDANSSGFAEAWHRGAEEDLIYLSLNDSVGGCIIQSGQNFNGKNQRAGEFGHMTIVPHGERCYCGQQGCVDVYCNAKVLSAHEGGDLDAFFEKLKSGKAEYRQIWNEYLDHLAQCVNNLRMVFDTKITIGGYVGTHIEEYIDDLRQLCAERNTFERDGSYVKACFYKSEATAVGAALLFLDAFIKSI